MPTLQVQQVELRDGPEFMVVWIDASWHLKAGQEVVGKDKRRWRVAIVYEQIVEAHHINHDWQVGGL